MNNKRFHLINRRELLIILTIAALAAASAAYMRFRSGRDSYAIIECGDISKSVSLDKDGLFSIDGINALFEVQDGKIRIKEAECPDKICERTGYIGSPGQSIICVPERITVTVRNSSDENNSADITIG